MRIRLQRGLVPIAAAGLILAACGDNGEPDDQAAPDDVEDAEDLEDLDEEALEDLLGGDPEDLEDPNEQVEDGVFRGNGVILPVPDGWSLDQQAYMQGIVAAVSEDGSQQLTAQAVRTDEAEAAGQPMDLDSLLDGIRQQVGEEAEVDEEVDLANADRAHRLTYLNLPSPREGAPDSSATIVLAEDDRGLVGEFAFSAATDAYDDSFEDVLVAEAGFDPDSEPPEAPAAPQPAPEEGQPEDQG